MPKRIKRLRVIEASLVDRPANPGARVTFFKRHELPGSEGDDVMDAETKQLLEELQSQLGDLTKSNDDLTRKNAEQSDALTEAQKEIKRLKKLAPGEVGDVEDDENPILKGLSPAARQVFQDIQKQNREFEERLRKQEEAQETAEAARKLAKQFPSLPFKPENFAPIYRKITKALQPDELISLERIFASHGAFAKLADREVGHAGLIEGDGGADAYAAIKSKAKDVRKLHPGMTEEQAFAKALEDDPELYARYRQEVM